MRSFIESLEILEALEAGFKKTKEADGTSYVPTEKMAYFISKADAEEYVRRLTQIKPGDTIKTLDGRQFIVTHIVHTDEAFPFFVVADFVEYENGVIPNILSTCKVPPFCLDLGIGMAMDSKECKAKYFAAFKATGRL